MIATKTPTNRAIIAAILIVTMTVSDVLNNAATAVVMVPIAFTVAQTLGVNPDPFLMAVAIGASCAFLTPIGHQNNALILGPGGFRFGDYWRLGLPDGRRTTDEVEKQIRRLVERALRDLREDRDAFGLDGV